MYKLLIGLMLASAMQQLGLSLKDFEGCHSRQCLSKLDEASRKVLRISWRPISLFPEEARRFQ